MMQKGSPAKTISIVRTGFREYYFKSNTYIEEPPQIEKREFGYAHFGNPGMTRHLSFKSIGELAATLVKEAPSDVFCSNAYYRFPSSPMQEKEWLGADVIFDIDGKDLNLPCVPSHSYSLCANCGSPSSLTEQGMEYTCYKCGGRKAEIISLPCNRCVDGSKKEVERLLQFLKSDLGIVGDKIDTYFSGNNGFHIHVRDDSYLPLNAAARSDLVGYISGAGLMTESIGVRKSSPENLALIKFPKGGLDYGWRKRIAEKLRIEGSSTIRLRNIVEQSGGYNAFKADIELMARSMGAKIDPQVTTDVHRIFRMPGTLNGKSGLAKSKCADLASFDPFVDACLLGDKKISLKILAPVKVRLRRRSYNLSKECAELPVYAAVYLICKGLAEAE
jgi:DNA primase small subunit